VLRAKLGLTVGSDDDRALADRWLTLLRTQRVDHTLAWRRLADETALRGLFTDPAPLDAWLEAWHRRLEDEPGGAAAATTRLQRSNPARVPRNHHVEAALAAAVDDGDLARFEHLLAATRDPFEDDDRFADIVEPAPAGFTDGYRTFCGT